MRYEISPLVTLSIFSVLLFFISFGPFTLAISFVVGLIWLDFFATLRAMKKIEISAALHPSRVFEGEEVETQVSFVNRSRFDFSPVDIEDFGVDGHMISGERSTGGVLAANERISLKYSVRFKRRGEHVFRDVRIRIANSFDLFKIDKIYKVKRKVLVFPELLPINRFKTVLIDPTEGVRADFRILEDPIHLYGVHEYESEPFQRIHWKVSAHTGELMVKEYEFTASSTVRVYVDYNLPKEVFAREVWSSIRASYEENVSKVASGVIKFLHDRGMQITLKIIASDLLTVTPQMANGDHIPYLEALSKANGVDEPDLSMESIMTNDIHDVSRNTTVVMFSLYLTDGIISKLLTVRARVARVVVFVIPYGFRMPDQKKYETHSVLPSDINELKRKSSLLRENGVTIHVVMDNESIDEVISGYDEKSGMDSR